MEREKSTQIVEQVIRPTGLLDPEIIVKPTEGQIDDLISEINLRVAKGNRVLVTTLTKKMAEDLTSYLEGMGIRVRYMHHEMCIRDSLYIKRKSSAVKAPHFRFLGGSEKVPDIVKQPRIGGGIGARRSADGRLVDVDDLVQILQPGDLIVFASPAFGTIQLRRQMLIQNFINQRDVYKRQA